MYVCSALALVLYHAWMDFHDIVLVSTLTCSTGRLQSRSATQQRPVSDSRSPPAGLTSWGLSKVTWLALHRCCGWWTGRAGTTFSSQKVNSCSFLRRTLATSTRWILHMWYVRTYVRVCVPLLVTLSVFTSDYFRNLVCPQVKITLHAPLPVCCQYPTGAQLTSMYLRIHLPFIIFVSGTNWASAIDHTIWRYSSHAQFRMHMYTLLGSFFWYPVLN